MLIRKTQRVFLVSARNLRKSAGNSGKDYAVKRRFETGKRNCLPGSAEEEVISAFPRKDMDRRIRTEH